jgi:serine protease Do
MTHARIKHLGLATLFLAFIPCAQAQLRNTPAMHSAFAPVVARPSESTVRIKSNGKDAALGAIVTADGHILTKHSELKSDKLTVHLKDGTELEAKVVNSDKTWDLALLKVEAKDLKPVEWVESSKSAIGRWVATPGTGKTPVAIGVLSVMARDLGIKGGAPVANANSGFLGVGLDLDFAGVKLSGIEPNGPAAKAGLKAGDQILTVNGEKVESGEDFVALVQKHKPNDVLNMKVLRDEKEIDIKATLGKRPGGGRGDMQNSMGSTLSERRTGFPTILQHDTILKPSECGGPLVDLEGRVIGLNIARAGRVESHAIPGEVVRKILPTLMEKK